MKPATTRNLYRYLQDNNIQLDLICTFKDSAGHETLVILDSRLGNAEKINRLSRAKREAEALVRKIEQMKKIRKQQRP